MPHADNLSRALLALILLCLVVVILRGDGSSPGPSGAPAGTALQSEAERYTIRVVGLNRKPPLMLRVDTATGEAWRMGVQGPGVWEALREGPDGVPSPGADVPGRYEVLAVKLRRGAPNLVRLDHHTGRIWRKGSTNRGAWVAVPNPSDASPAAAGASANSTAGDDDFDSEALDGGDEADEAEAEELYDDAA